ncbi:RHS repeat-associated core domain-containing protein [Pseudenhygromyxa sp. WMMC2535]|uniref:RHS repeat domain-containing protein n=1 Tax=Pseudenhygromyxa sp. WMMC2535 TaxID=2712867 RepID=UPI0015516753|nr:RHS repeat-associated core domain-containing protein [Pseudenhygromyxa sp. WMMC2535]NVB39965.1 RHS repeat-associated core domain-containing protein [Pseudenhygromyxa sp. WMMC2535]
MTSSAWLAGPRTSRRCLDWPSSSWSASSPFLSVAHNKTTANEDEYIETRSVLDIQGKVLAVIDARGNTAEARTYGMLGQSLRVTSVDAGDRWHLRNALGQPMRTWDSRDQRFSFSYDALRRPTDRTVSVAGDSSEKLLGRILYGEQLDTPALTNHRTRVYRAYDGAGVATTNAFDFKGHPTSEQRQLVSQKTSQPDWSPLLGTSTIPAMATAAAPLLDAETFSASSTRDALGRTLTALSPDGSEVTYGYDEGGHLTRVDLRHRGGPTLDTIVGDIAYDAKGQREQVIHGSTSSPTMTTSYRYDPQTYRLAHLSTLRESDDTSLQRLYYHYDPVGNVTDIRDTAQQTVYFQNSVVEAANSYTYDAMYRLIEATGREHSTQGTNQRTDVQISSGPQPMTSDPSAMRRYTQTYSYDSVGNILKIKHIPASGTGWTRRYEYDEYGNRLEANSAPGDPANGPYTHTYSYDAHGSMTSMPHLSSMVWNHDDELREVTVGSETVCFQYAGGIRSRKYTQKTGTTTEERIYLGPFELYRKRVNGVLDVERESLHISDGSGRICLVETKTVDGGSAVGSPVGIWRYQLGNHLGSACAEVDGSGAVISYEEYHPYGTSAYRAVDSSVDVSTKRYRYTGMEQDEETGLAYHSARYYVPWLGRWAAADPIGLGDGPNRYGYAGERPTSVADPNGNAPPKKTGWRTYQVGVDSPLGRQQEDTRALERDLQSERAILSELERSGATETEVEELRAVVADLEKAAFINRAVLDLAAGDQSAAERVSKSGISLTLRYDIGRRALSLQNQQAKYELESDQKAKASRVYLTAGGQFTESELHAQEFQREAAVVTGPFAGAVTFGVTGNVELAEAVNSVGGAFSVMAPGIRQPLGGGPRSQRPATPSPRKPPTAQRPTPKPVRSNVSSAAGGGRTKGAASIVSVNGSRVSCQRNAGR